jgi:hypothetical protein
MPILAAATLAPLALFLWTSTAWGQGAAPPDAGLDWLDRFGLVVAYVTVLSVMVEAVVSWLKGLSFTGIKALERMGLKAGWVYEWAYVLSLHRSQSPDEVMETLQGWLSVSQGEAVEEKVEQLKKLLDASNGLFARRMSEVLAPALGEQGAPLTAVQEAELLKRVKDEYFLQRVDYPRFERNRIARLRFLAISLGAALAYSLGLGGELALGGPLDAHTTNVVVSLTMGVMASQGSGFWHEQLRRLDSLKGIRAALGDLLPKQDTPRDPAQ